MWFVFFSLLVIMTIMNALCAVACFSFAVVPVVFPAIAATPAASGPTACAKQACLEFIPL